MAACVGTNSYLSMGDVRHIFFGKGHYPWRCIFTLEVKNSYRRDMMALYRSPEWTENTWQPFCIAEDNGLSDFGRGPPKKQSYEVWFKSG